MKQTNKSANGTSFHDTTIKASVNQLIKVLGEPCLAYFNNHEDKVSHEWEMETEDGDVFTIYDWKEYRVFDYDEQIEWHIGGKSKGITEKAKQEILNELHPLPF